MGGGQTWKIYGSIWVDEREIGILPISVVRRDAVITSSLNITWDKVESKIIATRLSLDVKFICKKLTVKDEAYKSTVNLYMKSWWVRSSAKQLSDFWTGVKIIPRRAPSKKLGSINRFELNTFGREPIASPMKKLKEELTPVSLSSTLKYEFK